jgi:hypothetical protein
MCMACCSTQTHYHHTEPVNILHLLINVAFSTNVIVVCLIQSEIEPTIYHTHGEHANLQSTTLMENTQTYNLPHSWRTREPTIYHTHGEHAKLQSTTLMENTRTYNLPHSWRTREPTIHHTHGEHANLQSTTLMENTRTYNLPHSWRTREPTIYHTHGEHAKHSTTDVVHLTMNRTISLLYVKKNFSVVWELW